MTQVRPPGASPDKAATLAARAGSVAPRNEFVVFRKEEIEQSVPARFEEQVRRYPGRLAVRTARHELTYDALNRAANRVARAILERRGQGAEPIALLLEHDAPLIAAILGVMKAGKFYVPMDPSYPEARNRFILEDSGAGVVLTDDRNLPIAAALAGRKTPVLDVGAIASTPGVPADDPGLAIASSANAYVIYTSGSTGRPKGVLQLHRNLLHNMMKYTNTAHLCADDRFSLLTSCSVSASRPDIFGALLNGGSVFPFAPRREGFSTLADWLVEQEITVYHSVPTLFRHFLESLPEGAAFPRVRLVKLGGEPILRRDVELYRRHFSPSCLLYAGLGGSEMGNIRVFFLDKQTEFDGNTVPAGFAMEDSEVLLLDENGDEVGPGLVGEIAVRSEYLPPGYWRRPDLTEAAFRPDPAGGGARIYRSGDLGRLGPDGCLEHLGRKDFQVKIRGNRVELSEIETALLGHPAVREAAVVARDDAKGERELAAYVVPRSNQRNILRELRAHLKQKLPEYMVPSALVLLEALPLTPNGKLDRRALPPLDPKRPELETPYVGPRDPLERRLTEIWERVLRVRPIGVKDDFFELGGHSILAARLFAEVERAMDRRLPLATLFQASTIELLARNLRDEGWLVPWSSLVRIQTGGEDRPPFFCVAGAGGNVVGLYDLARRLGPDQTVYGFQALGLDGEQEPHASVEEMAAYYVGEARSILPAGPFFLGGASFGGKVAFEMARQLDEAGQKVALIALFDTFARVSPGSSSKMTRIRNRLRNYRRRAAFHARNLLFRPQRRRYVRARLKTLTRRFRSRLWQAIYKSYERMARPLPRALRSVREAGHLASRRYEPKTYAGRVTLFRAAVRPIDDTPDHEMGWGPLALGGVEIREVPGGHVDMYDEPFVQTLAGELRSCIDRALEAEPPSQFGAATSGALSSS